MLVLAITAFMGLAATEIPVDGTPPLRVVPWVDYARYAGKWYEIAYLPQAAPRACVRDVTARHSARPDGTLTVISRCRDTSGRWREAEGVARPVSDQGPNSRLRVWFAPPILALLLRLAPPVLAFLPWIQEEYQVIAVAEDYRYALVGTPDRQALWVLSRTPQLDEASYQHLLARAREQGFAVAHVQRTPQSGP
jgi:apolipoprotein D and lipocalin family protein